MGKLLTQETYLTPRQPGSFGGVDAIFNALKVQRPNLPVAFKKDIRKWLSEKDAYTLHKPVRRKFPRRRYVTSGIDCLWQADLVDVSNIVEFNDGYRFMFVCIDVFSKYAWVVPLKNKSGKSVNEAFGKILQSGRRPRYLQTDKGKEFTNNLLHTTLNDVGITYYTTQNDDTKASIVERFNRTLKSKMWRYFTHANTFKYIDVIDDLVYSYNNTYHRTIRQTPSSVNKVNEKALWDRLHGISLGKPSPGQFKAGDKVRISNSTQVFKKGYLPNWTEEIFTVEADLMTQPSTYRLRDSAGDSIEGSFYDWELQKIVKSDDVFVIEKILATRKKGRVNEYFVKWRGYPDKFNSWIKESDLAKPI